MQNTTLYLPGFHLSTLRRRPLSASRRLAEKRAQLKQKSLSELGQCFRQFIFTQFLQQSDSGGSSRRRLFSKENTFWAFFSQVLDADVYSAHDIADLYRQRWDVELFFREFKTTLGMDILRCKTPVMVNKEILMSFIVYNGLRQLMGQAA
jgi:IS4 transposase